jgi:hypothetical protein
MTLFRVTVLEGRGFGSDVQALRCVATLAGEAKETPWSVGGDAHAWNSTLLWEVEARTASSSVSGAKVAVHRKDGACVGWVVLNLRAAKINHQYGRGADGEQRPGLRCSSTSLHALVPAAVSISCAARIHASAPTPALYTSGPRPAPPLQASGCS